MIEPKPYHPDAIHAIIRQLPQEDAEKLYSHIWWLTTLALDWENLGRWKG